MKTDKSTKAIVAVVVVLLVCAGTFLIAKSFTNKAAEKVTTTAAPYISQYVPVYTEPSTQPTTAPSTELTTVPTTAATTMGTTAYQPITTYPVSTTTPSVITTQATTAAPVLTTKAPTTASTTKKPAGSGSSSSAADSIIKNAALFSQGFLSYMFNPDGNFYYTNEDPWQRALGFNKYYDACGGFVVIYIDTVRIKFDYADKNWMVQFWKGQYGWVFIGAEVGVYTKPTSRTVDHYDAASNDDALMMSMTCLRKGSELFTRDYGKYWWCTGFVPGTLDKFSDRSELQVQARITMKDSKMLKSFKAGCDEAGFTFNGNYTVDGLDVYIKW